ncbi:hypothetical protein [Lacisediminihabitans sp. H27-G8]|uniref:hypothetical protein n=1 Tax=Lacisediminihabitans sp. H27-G8 TaxID=3111909 RepID=UPI0038FC5572
MMAITRLFDAVRAIAARRRDREQSEAGVALLTAILFMLLVAGLSVVLLSVILSQATPVFTAQKNTRTVYAAQAGIQASLGVVRSLAQTDIATGKTTGIRSKLPCTVAGKVDGNDATSTYSVVMKYFMVDPTGKDTAWQDANDMDCAGSVLSGTTQPLFALALADGIGAAVPGQADAAYGNRYISAVYKFKVSNVNIAGGRIYDYNNGFCLQASSAVVGATIVFKSAANCKSANDATQLWVYDVDYEIKLASSLLTSPLCISSPTNAGKTAALAGNAVLAVCRSDATRWNQLWSWFGSNTWQGQQANNTDYSNFYLSSATPATDVVLTVSTTTGGGFTPTTAVGAGAASYNTNQMVNYKEFGRCADVTDQSIGKAFMISYPCKQDPTGTGTKLNWNHKWFYTEPTLPSASLGNQQIVVYDQGDAAKKNCLTTPSAGGKLVTFTLCNNGNTTTQRWTRFLNTGTYATSYLFTDYLGRCLAVDATDTYTSGQWSKMIVTGCNGGLEQKWNAPAIYSDSDVSGYKEYSK